MNSTHMNGAIRILAVLMFSILFGCGGGGGSGGSSSNTTAGTTDKTVATVTMVDGDNQTSTVGTELPTALTALIKNSSGQPISGQIVNFVVTTGGGSVFAGAAMSDVSGMARERWTLGTVSGQQKVEVRAVGASGNAVVFATFTATAAAGAAQSISISSGNYQSAMQLQPLAIPVVSIVKDSYGNPVAGISVSFAASNGGSAAPGLVTTDTSGTATTTWTLGQTIGGQTLSAAATGLIPASFNATAMQAPAGAAKTIAKVSGDSQTIAQHSQLPVPFQVVVTDAFGNPVAGTQVTFSAASGSGFINPSTLNIVFYGTYPYAQMKTTVTDSNGKANWTGYLHTAGQQKIEVSAAGTGVVTFNTIVTASNNHLYDGLYNCSKTKFSDNSSTSFSIYVTNGLIPVDHNLSANYDGILNENNGNISVFNKVKAGQYQTQSGQLIVNSLQQVTGSGNIYDVEAFTYFAGLNQSGTVNNFTILGSWSCVRP